MDEGNNMPYVNKPRPYKKEYKKQKARGAGGSGIVIIRYKFQ